MVWEYVNEYGFFGNSVLQYIYFVVTILAALFIAKVVFKMFKGAVRRATKKTKTQLDDIIVDSIEEPIVFAIAIIGIYFALNFLTIPESILGVLNKILMVLVYIDVTWLFARTAGQIINKLLSPLVHKSQPELGEHFTYLLNRLIKIAIWVVGIVFIISNLGYNVSTLIAGLGIGGVAIAFAVKDILSNMFGGVTVITDMPFKVGDRIRIEGIDGNVTEIGLRSTKIKSLDGTQYIVPNSKVTSTIIENVSREKARKVKMTIGLEYDTSNKKLDEAKDIIRDIVKKNKATEDKSLVYFTNFGDSALEVLVIYYIKDLKKILSTKDEINMQIKERFEKKKINMAFPTHTVYVKE